MLSYKIQQYNTTLQLHLTSESVCTSTDSYMYREIHKRINSGAGIALDYGLDDRGFESLQGLGIFLFTTMSRPALGPIQPPIQWVPGALSLGGKAVGA